MMMSVKVLVVSCGSVQHTKVLRGISQGKPGDGFEHFQSLYCFGKASFILGIDLWEYKFGSLLFSVSMETAAKLKMHM